MLAGVSRFENKGVLVTGAASGIGKATVERLLAEGATVVGVDIADRTDVANDRYAPRGATTASPT
jgi:NAD(P)-dependent dehydrogenase (short-subunit alcohol dehydrogenase family)